MNRMFTKSYARLFTGIVLMSGVAISVFYGCKKPSDNVKIFINTSSLSKAPVLLHFVNANTASTAQPGDFSVTISGKDSAFVQMDGGATTNFKASHGFLPLSLLSAAAPSVANPITFNISASIAGFAPLTQTITITKDTATIVDISAIQYSSPPAGVSTLVSTVNINAGVSPGIVFTVPTNAGMTEAANIIIPAGTQFLDVNGNLISASQVTADVAYYSPISPTSYGAFPGGFHPTNVVDLNGNPINGGYGINFVSAGLLSVKMFAGSTEVKHFSNPIIINMEINPNTTNFTTGLNIEPGDTVPWWSMNESTGQWTSEGIDTLAAEAPGGLATSSLRTNGAAGKAVASLKPTHLSAFNLDWSWAVAGTAYGTCGSPLTVTIHMGAGNSGVYDVALVTPDNQYLGALHGAYLTDGLKVTFPNTPQIAQAKVVISTFNLYLNPSLPILAQTALFNPCTQGSIDLTFTPPAQPNYVNVSLNINGHCTNKDVDILASGWFYLVDQTANAYTYAYVYQGALKYTVGAPISGSNGIYTMQLISGHNYILEAWNSNTWYQSNPFALSKSGFAVQNGGFTGTGVYSSSSNTININCTYSVACN
jgi:hypothetical protein